MTRNTKPAALWRAAGSKDALSLAATHHEYGRATACKQGRLLRAALDLAVIGLGAVPTIAAEKRPALKGWRKRASIDLDAVETLFTDAPHATGLAITTGGGVFVIDLDRGHADGADGVASFAAIIAEHGGGEPLALGPRTRTPRGGVHLWFACDAALRIRNRVGTVPGVDVRGDGGLAIAAPSPGYRWEPSPWERNLPPAPAWLLRLIAPPTQPPRRFGSVRPFGGDVSPYARAALEREPRAVAAAPAGVRNAARYKASASLGGLCAAGLLPVEPVAQALLEAATAYGLKATMANTRCASLSQAASNTGSPIRALSRNKSTRIGGAHELRPA